MAPPTIVASDIMDGAAAILNDVNRRLFTNTIQLPYLKRANKSLEQLLAVYDIEINHETSAAIDVAAGAKSVDLPNDFLVPNKLYERADGSTKESDWVQMQEVDEIPNAAMGTTLGVWSFEDNTIKLLGSTADREVKLVYERMLAAISAANSPVDDYKIQPWLEAKTAELCARFVGENKAKADDIKDNELALAEDNLLRIFVLDQQGVRHRRGRYSSNAQ